MFDSNEEQNFISTYNKNDYEKPSVTVDILIFTIENDELKIVLVKRKEMPFAGCLALPGVFVKMDETLEMAARRAIEEKVGICDVYLEQLFTWGDINRDPRMRIISISYLALVSSEQLKLINGNKVLEVSLLPVNRMIDEKEKLAFDHLEMLKYALERIKNKVEYTKIAFEFVGEEFSLPALQTVYEILLGKRLYKANFRKKIMPLVKETDKKTEGDAHRPSKLYTLKETDDESHKGFY